MRTADASITHATGNGLWQSIERVHLLLTTHLSGERPQVTPRSPKQKGKRGSHASAAETSPLDTLATAFSLSPFERDVLSLCAGVELDPRIRVQCTQAHGDPQRVQATFGLALAAFPDPHWSALSPSATLRRWLLIDVAPADILTTAPLRIDERILHFLLGVPAQDPRVGCVVRRVAPPLELPPSHRELTARIAQSLAFVPGNPVIQLCGGHESERAAIAAAVTTALGIPLNRLDATELPASPAERELLSRLLEREALLTGTALLVQAEELSSGAPAFFESVGCVLFVDRTPPLSTLGRDVLRFELPPSTATEQRLLWRAALGKSEASLNGQVEQVAEHFQLGPRAIRAAAAEVRRRIAMGEPVGAALWDACRAEARPRLSDLAQRIEPHATWDAMVLPVATLQTLRTIAAQVRQRATVYRDWGFERMGARGLGVSALFSGASGTGKTMAAEVLAAELALDLYRIDLSTLVSKYVGETEKNLRRVFDGAEEGGAILLFDEADALFGRRTEVKDSHDRYANVEVSYLLQRLESYRGLAILTTNMRNAIDPAFLRRIRFIVNFPFPDAAQRTEIWRRVYPAATPTDGLDLGKLAGLPLAGGSIRNLALNAAFLAADTREPVRMAHLLAAAATEYAKLERPPLGNRHGRVGMTTPAPRAVYLHIESLVLHGFAPGDRRSISDALARELTAAISRDGIPASLHSAGEIPRVDAGAFTLPTGSRPMATGKAVARAIHASLRP